ncbi:hypothetical protein NFI95_08610 [Acetobacteraceae bacterium KSS8]|uniref:Ornithine cyclodeaminase n=1 Tax=Endosaccharibacter trunci TaxID=2812733 RepID=A0ABT1W6L1_9PROT|nr:hypothetical protein [Acetobacteraceae bacterium KSS8]
MSRLVTAADAARLGGGDVIAAMRDVRACLQLLRRREAGMPAEISVPLSEQAGGQARAYALPAWLGDPFDVVGMKWTAHRQLRPAGAPAAVSVTLVNDRHTGDMLGMVESDLLTVTRTAAVSALALQALRLDGSRPIAVLGAGAQAHAHLRMLAAVFPGHPVRLWNRTAEIGRRLCEDDHAAWSGSIESALDGAAAVLCCTAAPQPILQARHMRPDLSVLQIGYHEVSFDAIDTFAHIAVDLWGPFSETSAKSLFKMYRAGRIRPRRVCADLAAIALDRWQPPSDSALYFSSFGLNLFDVALATRILKLARLEGSAA